MKNIITDCDEAQSFGHGIMILQRLRAFTERCRDHYFRERCPERCHIIIYANALSNGFVNDDDATVANNALIKDIGNLPKLFEKEYFTLSGENSYRPFVTVTYFLDYSLFGLSPLGFHLTNILLHALNAIFLYLFLTLFIGASNNKTALGINSTPPSVLSSFADHFQGRPYRLLSDKPLFITLLFVTHPALTETVNAISFREDLLVFLFYMATLNLYIIIRSDFQMRRSPVLYTISCLTYSFALLSKEMAATLPLIVCCYEWIYKNRTKGLFPILINPYNIGYIAITSVYIYIRFYYFHNPVIVNIPEWSIIEKILTVPWLLLSYVKLILMGGIHLTQVTTIYSMFQYERSSASSSGEGLPAYVPGVFGMVCR